MKVTVVIPTIEGRESILLSCLSSVFNQDYTDWEFILCTTNLNVKLTNRDDELYINRFLRTINDFGHTVRVLHDESKIGPGKAVQMLLDNSRTRLVFRVDDDVLLTPQVLSKLIETYQMDEENIAAVCSPVNGFGVRPVNYKRYWGKKNNGKHLIGNGSYESMNDNCMHHSAENCKKAIAEVDFLSGYCLLLDNEKCKKVGGYIAPESPHHHKEDWFATLRLRTMGYRLLIRADAIAFHHHYGKDESDRYRSERSVVDHQLFNSYRSNIRLPDDRDLGLIHYES